MTILLRLLLLLALLTTAPCCFAATYRTVATLAPWPNGVVFQTGLVRGPDGSYYGITRGGGLYNVGTIFKVSPAGAFTLLASFNPNATGSVPNSLVLGADGNFYGTCVYGGTINFNGAYNSNGDGTIFKLTPDGVLSPFHFFTGLYGDGQQPSHLLQGADGSLYGLAQGQPGAVPEFFRISPSTRVLTTYQDPYHPIPDGLNLYFQGSDGFFYGTTSAGILVRLNVTGQATAANQLPGGSQFSYLAPGPSGSIYATVTTATGGSLEQFSTSVQGPSTRIATFSPSTLNAIPDGGFSVGTDGNIYGAGEIPGSNNSVIFKAVVGGAVTPLYTVVGNFALLPVLDPDGDLLWELFGGAGTVDKLSHGNVSTLVDLNPMTITRPTGPLLQARDGNFYGTGALGGQANFGGVYKVTAAGQKTDVGSFQQKLTPFGVIQATDGNFYGVAGSTATNTGVNGIFFKITAGNVMTTFTPNFPGVPASPIVQAADGNFYGLTNTGGAFNAGTFYQVTPAGNVTVICSLDNTMSIPGPYAATFQQIVVGRDHNFYAATPVALLKIAGPPTAETPPPVVPAVVKPVVLQSFTSSTGFAPTCLTLGPGGNIYGTSLAGGSNNQGFYFEFTPQGKYTLLASLGAMQISGPYGMPLTIQAGGPTSLAFGNDGFLYIAANGGPGTDSSHTYIGVLLQAGNGFRSLMFGSTAGDAPNSIIQGTDGTLYGTTSLGGTAVAYTGGVFSGTVFNVDPGLLRGTVIGTAGTYNIKAGNNTIANAFDGNITSFFDAPAHGTGDWVGLDLGAPQFISAIAFVPRTNYENRMIGGVFQGSDTPDFSSGVVDLTAPITTYPGDRFNTIVVQPIAVGPAYRYVRYLSPDKGFGNINELEFYSDGAPPHMGGGG